MANKKVDGIIEAVRYQPDGKISCVRFYERRGVVWSDAFLLQREDLAMRLKKGKQIMTGTRQAYLGSTFATRIAIKEMGSTIITPGQAENRDLLDGVPVF